MAGRQFLSQINKFRESKKQPIAEIIGKGRVLIENHQGVLAYSDKEIGIKVAYGTIEITGCNLQLMEISSEQLVVKGVVDSLQLLGR